SANRAKRATWATSSGEMRVGMGSHARRLPGQPHGLATVGALPSLHGRQRVGQRQRERHRMSAHPFLSDDWLVEARRIRAEFRGKAPEIPVSVRMNQIIQDVPFGDGTIK